MENSKFSKLVVIIIGLLFFSPLVYAERLLIDNFNDGEKPSLISGDFGAWNKSETDTTQFCIESFDRSKNIFGGKGCSLQLDYDVDSPRPAYNGFWMRLEKIDLRRYKYLIFYVRGDYYKCFTTRFKVELKNIVKMIKGEDFDPCPSKAPRRGKIKESDIAIYEIEGIDAQWRQVIIPLEPALRDADFSEAYEFTIVFEDHFVTQKKGRIYIDNIYLTDGEVYPVSVKNRFR